MKPTGQEIRPLASSLWMIALMLCAAVATNTALGAIYTLKNNVQVEGVPGKISSLGVDPLKSNGGGAASPKLILFVDDNIRRTFFSFYQFQSQVPSPEASLEKIVIRQRVAQGGKRLASVGVILGVTPFDEFGRRVFKLVSARGPLDIYQGITEITPTYTKVEGLASKTPIVWETRIATSSIPRTTLSNILTNHLDMNKPSDRLRIVRLYMQAERYQDALFELEAAIEKFPDLANLKDQVRELYQHLAEHLIREIELRQDAGQYVRTFQWLSNFPRKGVANETLLQVRDLLNEYQTTITKRDEVFALLDQHYESISDEGIKQQLLPILDEIKTQLTVNTLSRMAPYLRLSDDEDLTAGAKLALAVSGWLMDEGGEIENLAVATSLFEVRNAVRKYLAIDNLVEHQEILEQLSELEGSSPQNVTRLLAAMKPAVVTEPQDNGVPGFYHMKTPGLTGEPDVEYLLQLPPDYDPYRRYQVILTLHGAGTSPQQQLEWWTGAYDKKMNMRMGQATRHGYIVIAPAWHKGKSQEYGYSAREHAAVLFSLRDACRRFNIDTDRVFLSGHSIGGDAAWDIGLAHPDLWAGVIPITATADKYVSLYWENGRRVAFYFVGGEMDGNRVALNARDLNRYLTRPGFDTMIVEYRGRGHEHFHDEIHRIFDWMNLHRRQFFHEDFKCSSLRPWDNFFWWVELADFPDRSIVVPLAWPNPQARASTTEGVIGPNNRVRVRSAARQVTVWLSPEMIDFNERITVSINGRLYGQDIEPSLEVLLEDVRTRGDRFHPFWARVGS
ncbi:MAG TPA: peptidase [Planctomycetaceae bacterium]|nr:peptidase [Planctomycetaceae bacterium]